MPIEHRIWKVGDQPEELPVCRLDSERLLEDMIVSQPNILSSEWMLIGRQVTTSYGGRADLLAIAPDASLVLIELKRDRTARELVAQSLDYASWVEQLAPESVAEIYRRFKDGADLNVAFRARFGADLEEEDLNQSHQIVLVATELDNSTERIIEYVNAREVAINVLFFKVFQYGSDRLLSRAWLIDPSEAQSNAVGATRHRGRKEPWNGEYYVSFGPPTHRCWEDARTYGFISAGGGVFASGTLRMLSPDDRIWVRIPKVGYVGVGRVVESACPAKDFKVKTPDVEKPVLDVLTRADYCRHYSDDPERTEYFVRVEWLHDRPEAEAVHELGLFANQHPVCSPTTPIWRATVQRLKTHFPNWDAEKRH